jgi:hypothetical protein
MILSRHHRPMLKRRIERDKAKRRERDAKEAGEREGHKRAVAELTQVTVVERGQCRAYIENAGPPTRPLWRVVVPVRPRLRYRPSSPPEPIEVIDFESVQMALTVQTGKLPDEYTHLVWWEWRPRGHAIPAVFKTTTLRSRRGECAP